MTDKEKLQRLFDAALKDSTNPLAPAPTRAFPVSHSLDAVPVPAASVPVPQPMVSPVFQAAPQASAPAPVVPVASLPTETVAPATRPTMAAVLDDAASTELAALLDEQQKRKARKRRVEALVTALVFLGMTGGGSAWFVQSPQRVQAFKEAMRDIRSVGDVKSLVAKYQNALDRVSARAKQVDQATAAMGVKKSAQDDIDPFMDAEMKQLMGGEGKTVGERNRAMVKNFGDMAKENGGVPKATAALKEGEAFDWNK